ncbi:MAG: FAD-dependent oxidoreductase [Hyphomicrobiaceae bacterium]
MHVAVIGAGIVGVQVAHELLDDGHSVTFVDPDGIAERTSRGNAGFIAHTDIMPLASPKVWRHLPGWLLDPLGPLTIRPSYAHRILPWMLRFVAASAPSRIEASIAALTQLNGLSLPAWERRLKKLGLTDRHLRRSGYLYVWASRPDFEASKSTLKRQQALGIPVEILDSNAAVRKLEPAYGPAIVGGAHYPTGARVDEPASVAKSLGAEALKRGATMRQTAVETIRPVQGGVAIGLKDGGTLEADMAVIAAGAWSKPLAAQLGDRIPLDTERGYNLTLPKGSLGLTRPVIHEGLGFATSVFDDTDRIGGAVEFAGLDAPPNYKRVDAIIARAKRVLPDAKFDDGTRWMGFRPSLPDSMPVIGRSSASDRIVYAFGHGHHGLTESAATAEIVGAMVSQKASPIDAEPFRAQRF